MGERIAHVMRVRYQYLKAQNLSPSAIMSSLYEMVTGSARSHQHDRSLHKPCSLFCSKAAIYFEDDPSKVPS